jgi:hypothetical protein
MAFGHSSRGFAILNESTHAVMMNDMANAVPMMRRCVCRRYRSDQKGYASGGF